MQRRNRLDSRSVSFCLLLGLTLSGVMLVIAGGCNGKAGQLQSAKLLPTASDVASRHDAYVRADTTLAEPDRAQYLVESQQLLVALGEADSVPPASIDATLRLVSARHDAYINADPALTPLRRRVWLRDTAVLRLAVDAAKGPSQPAVTHP